MGAPSDADAGPASGKQGGFRSQPLWLRVLLIASLVALATGVVMCSFEVTTPTASVRSGAP